LRYDPGTPRNLILSAGGCSMTPPFSKGLARLMLIAAYIAASWAGADARPAPSTTEMDRVLSEITVPRLHALYAQHKYTVTDVVRWHIDRVRRYNGVYRAVETLMESEALAEAARQDAEAAHGKFSRGPLWGVPIVVKANTSIAGQVTTDGWAGYTLKGHELIAPRDATVVARLRRAGAVIIGHTNMPDFANSDTNRSTSFGRTGNAYDVRFSPGGSSGGTVTAVNANMAVLGTGTDTGNSIRMPAATSALIGVFPTRGLVSIAGIAPLDWLLDNTGPIARNVTDAAITLSVMAGEDPLDPPTIGSAALAQPGPYTRYLAADALKGRRFGVPAFILSGSGIPFHGLPSEIPEAAAARERDTATVPLAPATKAAFLKALDELRALGATVVVDESILPESFAREASRIATYPYVREGTERFLENFGPAEFRSPDAYAQAVGAPLSPVIAGDARHIATVAGVPIPHRRLESDPAVEHDFLGPRRRTLETYVATMERLHLDGYVYPAIQIPPPDETMPQNGALSDGPHSATDWVNMIGVPAIVVVGGWYPGGLPFGLEFSARPWRDGDLLGYAYAWERATRHRRPPVLVDRGLLPDAP
jgi:Asp-tRNA(Asn)/Glu-tRNA(Gln) amidotransferase A subunit family amidase